MYYRAKKPCKFVRAYGVGEEIPASEVDENRAGALIKYGIIEIVPKSPQDGVKETGHTNTSPESETASDGVKSALNAKDNGTSKAAAQTQTRKSTPAKKPAAKKGGK